MFNRVQGTSAETSAKSNSSLFKAVCALSVALALVFTSVAIMPTEAHAATTTKCYTIKSGNTTVYSNTGLTKKYGTIYSTDEITVKSVSSKYCKVTYPISKGTKTGYVATSSILTKTSGTAYTCGAKVTTYKRPGGATYGYVSKGDKVTVLGTSGSYTQVKYPVSGGYKYAFVKTTDKNKYIPVSSTKSSSDTKTTDKTQTATESAVQARLDKIANGSLKYNSKTVMSVGSKFSGTRAGECCKGYAKNVFYMCFGVAPNSTQDYEEGLNYLLYDTKGMTRLGAYTTLTASEAKSLFSKARPGDFVQMKRHRGSSHSAIVYSVSSKGVTWLEANTDGHNTVTKTTYTWADLTTKNTAMSLYTATNYKLK